MLSTEPFECPSYLLAKAAPLPPIRTAVVNAGAALPMESARLAVERGIIEPVLIGEPDAISSAAKSMQWDISHVQIVTAHGEAQAATIAAAMAANDQVDIIMKGHIHTDAFMSALVKAEAGLRTDRRFTHVFHMTVPHRDAVLLISDAAVNVHPDVDTKMQIVKNAVDLAHALGNQEPRVALLSATEAVTERMPSSVHAATLAERARTEVPGAIVHGPLAFDNAISPQAVKIKGIEHPVAGHADILVVPDIVTGNALFKMMVYFMSACAAGVVLGAKVPIILTSRADPPEARLASAAIAAILSDRRHGAPA